MSEENYVPYQRISKNAQKRMLELVGKRAEQQAVSQKLEKYNLLNIKDWQKETKKIIQKIDPGKTPTADDVKLVKKVATSNSAVDASKIDPDLANKVTSNAIEEKLGLKPKREQMNYQERSINSLQSWNAESKGNLVSNFSRINPSKDNFYVTFSNGILKPNSIKGFGLDGYARISTQDYFIENKITEGAMTRQTDRSLLTFVEACKDVSVTPIVVIKDVKAPEWATTCARLKTINSSTMIFSVYQFTSWLSRKKCKTVKEKVTQGTAALNTIKSILGKKAKGRDV